MHFQTKPCSQTPLVNRSVYTWYLELSIYPLILQGIIYTTLGTWSYPSIHSSFKVLYTLHLVPGAIHPSRYNIHYTGYLELSILQGTIYSTLGTWSYPSFKVQYTLHWVPGAIHPSRYNILCTEYMELYILQCTIYSTLSTWSYPSFKVQYTLHWVPGAIHPSRYNILCTEYTRAIHPFTHPLEHYIPIIKIKLLTFKNDWIFLLK